MKARKKKAAKRAAKRTTEITEKVAANAEDKKAEVVDSTEKTAAAQDTTKKEVKAEPAKEEKKPEVKAEPVKEETKTEAKVEPVKEEKKPEVKAEPVKKETEKAENTKELEQEFERRMARHYDELKWLYCELYENRMDMFEDLCKNLKNIYMDRKPDLKKQERLPTPRNGSRKAPAGGIAMQTALTPLPTGNISTAAGTTLMPTDG